jgi:endoglucanase
MFRYTIVLPLFVLLGGCQSPPQQKAAAEAQVAPVISEPAHSETSQAAAPKIKLAAAKVPVAVNPATSVPPAPFVPVRIKAAGTESFKDSAGNMWLPDQGFDGGLTIARPEIEITNTTDPTIYRAERYSMESFSWSVPNGNYVMKLHFAETFEGISGPGQRVFSFNAQGHEFKDFDVWQKAGGPLRAYVETVPVIATNGALKVTFTSNIENPQINGIEILPAP